MHNLKCHLDIFKWVEEVYYLLLWDFSAPLLIKWGRLANDKSSANGRL